jgi:protein-arginine kinase
VAKNVYDLYNNKSLGRTEVDIIQNLYDGVRAIIEKEKDIAEKLEGEKQAR